MSDCLDYKHTLRFSKLFLDYINQKATTKRFYNRFPLLENFKNQIKEKQQNYNQNNRKLLSQALKDQYKDFNISKNSKTHIENLEKPNTFTITTGHQLNLFTGPIYTFYKIISVINTCNILKTEYPDYNFVPIFWLASEDHDFDEINHFYFSDKKISWQENAAGAVGELNTEDLNNVLNEFEDYLPNTKNAENLVQLFKNSYLKHDDLSRASIHLYNELFGDEGLVIIEPNHKKLKSCFKTYVHEELTSQITLDKVSNTSKKLAKEGYHEQVTPRDINLFYLTKNRRERIIFKDGKYFINHTEQVFSKDEIQNEVDNHPERFSPNALLRPLYQEVLLPNLSYVGGAGELAYWLQLQSTFYAFDVSFPMLQMRNSALLISGKTLRKLNKLEIQPKNLFQSPIELKNQHVKNISEIEIDFSKQKKHLSQQFKELYELAEKTDKTFLNAVAAQEKKQHNGLDKLEKRLLKAQRRKLTDETDRLTKLQDKLFPLQKLQERHINYSELYLSYGDDLKSYLIENLEPFKYKFSLLTLQPQTKSLKQKYVSKCI